MKKKINIDKTLRSCAVWGPILIILGILFPWQTKQAVPGTFVQNYPIQAGALILIALSMGVLTRLKKLILLIGMAVIFIVTSIYYFALFYFGRFGPQLYESLRNPLEIAGWVIIEFGLVFIGASIVGLELQRRKE